MNHGLMEGMLWAGLLLVVVPLAVGVGVLVLLVRHRRREDGSDVPAGG